MARPLSSQPTWDCLLHPKGKEGTGKRQCFLEKAGFYQVEHCPVPIGYAKAPHGTLLPSTARSAMELDSYQLPHSTREANEKVGENGDKGLGEAAQWLRAYAVLPQDPSSVSSTHVRWPTTDYKVSSREIWHLWPPLEKRVVAKRALGMPASAPLAWLRLPGP